MARCTKAFGTIRADVQVGVSIAARDTGVEVFRGHGGADSRLSEDAAVVGRVADYRKAHVLLLLIVLQALEADVLDGGRTRRGASRDAARRNVERETESAVQEVTRGAQSPVAVWSGVQIPRFMARAGEADRHPNDVGRTQGGKAVVRRISRRQRRSCRGERLHGELTFAVPGQ